MGNRNPYYTWINLKAQSTIRTTCDHNLLKRWKKGGLSYYMITIILLICFIFEKKKRKKEKKLEIIIALKSYSQWSLYM